MNLAPAAAVRPRSPVLAPAASQGQDFDLIDAHYFYPDGIAAVLLGRALGKPVTITARGTDINLIPQHALPRRMIRWAGRTSRRHDRRLRSARTTRWSRSALPGHRIRVLRNGVDLASFQPTARDETRAELGLNGADAAVGRASDRAQGS